MSRRRLAAAVAVADFAVTMAVPVVGYPDAIVPEFIAAFHVPAVAAAVIAALHDPATGYPDPDGNHLPITVGTAIFVAIPDDHGIVVVMTVVDGRGDDEAAEKTTDDSQPLVAGDSGFRGEGECGGGSKGKSDDFGFHMFSKVGFTP